MSNMNCTRVTIGMKLLLRGTEELIESDANEETEAGSLSLFESCFGSYKVSLCR